MFADLSTNLSKYKTIQILLENCIRTVNKGILTNSRLWQLRSDGTMCDGLYTLLQNVNGQFMRGIRRVSPLQYRLTQ